ncbi:MAG TPA: hypothetical protein VNF07_05640 [Acidimicrobiales bacterium]|nr:hypothetical protein [Acidimicrobiales bacterium]
MAAGDQRSLGDRLRGAFLKPVDPHAAPPKPQAERRTAEELESSLRSADDKERAVGLIAAPFAALIGVLVIDQLIRNDPPARLNGLVNKLHVSVALYHELTIVLVVLSILILVMAMLRKRLLLGIVMALFGLAIFNLHYWGFGVPFIGCASWLLVRAYRIQRELRDASGGGPSGGGAHPRSGSRLPRSNKRYTPPSSVRARRADGNRAT